MEKVILEVLVREETGKTKVKALRKQDLIPAVVYKDGKKAANIKIGRRKIFDILHTGANIIATRTMPRE